MRPECGHLARDLVPHREGQAHAARFERDLLPAPQIKISVPDVHVAMAHPRRLDAQQHLLALRLGIRILPRFERLAPFDDLHRPHPGALRFEIFTLAEPFDRPLPMNRARRQTTWLRNCASPRQRRPGCRV